MTLTDVKSIDTITFDCYGTLVDWEKGILDFVQDKVALSNADVTGQEILRAYAAAEKQFEGRAYTPYKSVLALTYSTMLEELGFPPSDNDAALFSESVGDWEPFPDTVEALHSLSKTFRLGILSNIDDDLFERSANKLKVDFTFVVTAQQVRSYKPNLNHFRQAISEHSCHAPNWLHVAQSKFHDIAPCNELGIQCVWVERPSINGSEGVAPTSHAKPSWHVQSMREFANAILPAKLA